MADIQYKRNVIWDDTLQDLGFNSDGLVISGQKITSGAPTATAGYFAPSAIIQNVSTGIIYQNTGTTDTPTWGVVEAQRVPVVIPLNEGEILVGDDSDEAAAVPLSGDATID